MVKKVVVMSCFIPGCKSGYVSDRRKNKEAGIKNNSFFRARTDQMLQAWRAAISRTDKLLEKKDRVCALHFKECEIEREYITAMPNGTVHRIPKGNPTLVTGAVPSIFPKIDSCRKRILPGNNDSNNDQPPEKKKKDDNDQAVQSLQISVDQPEIVDSDNTSIRDVSSEIVLCTEESEPALDIRLRVQEWISEDHSYCLSVESLFARIEQNIKSIPRPSNMWIPCAAYGHATWTLWNNDLSAIEKRVVIYQDMTVRIFIRQREITVDDITKIKSVDEVTDVLKRVSALLPCKTGSDTERVKDCKGYVLKKRKSQRGPQAVRCDPCKKYRKASLKKSTKTGALHKQRQKTFKLKGHCKNITRRNIRLKNKIRELRQKLKAAKEECAETNKHALEQAISKLPVNQREAVQACFAASKVKGPNGMRYTNQWIYECLLLRIKSSKTYNHLRTHKILALPSPKTLDRYIKVIEGTYGFDKSVFQVLQKKTASMSLGERHGILLVDEMKLSKSVSFSKRNLKVHGFTNLGKYTPKHHARERGDHALVLMFQPFQGKWVQSIACFLSKGCASGTVLHQILVEAIILTERAGLYIDAVASDGASWNRAMWNKFGMADGQVSVTHIVDSTRHLWFFSDFPHLVKNARNFFTKFRQNLIWTPDGTVDIKHWEALLEIEDPKSYELKVNYKLTSDHIRPQYYQKMNVALAFQFFGVADSMQLLQNEHKDLQNSAGTQNLCRRMKKLIKAMNSRTPLGSMKPGNKAWQTVIDFSAYLRTWEEEARKHGYEFLTDSTSYGLKVSLQAAVEICQYLVEVCGFKYLMTARLNQDNLERFFGMMRSCCGSNDHPDSTLFIQMYKLVSTYSLVKPPKGSNISGGEVMDVLLDIKDITDHEERKAQFEAQIDTILDRGSTDVLSDAASILTEHAYSKCSISEYVLTYISGYVTRKGKRFATFKTRKQSVVCKDCLNSLELSPSESITERYKLIDIRSRGFLKYPSVKLFDLIALLEQATLTALSKHELNAETLFNITEAVDELSHLPFVGCQVHERLLTHSIVRFYLTTRMYFVCKQSNKNENIENKQTRERRKAAKLTHAAKNSKQATQKLNSREGEPKSGNCECVGTGFRTIRKILADKTNIS